MIAKLQGINLKQQFLAGTLIFAVVTLTLGGYALSTSRTQSDSIDWAGRVFLANESLHDARDAFTAARRGARSYLLYGDKAGLAQYESEIAELQTNLSTAYLLLKSDVPSVIPLLDRLYASIGQWQAAEAQQGIALREGWTGTGAELQTAALEFAQDPVVREIFDQTSKEFDSSLLAVQTGLVSRVGEVQTTSRDLVSVLVATMTVMLALLVVNGLYLYRGIARPLGRLSDAALGIARGDFSRRTGIAKDNEIGRAAGAFDVMASEIQQLVAGLEIAQSELFERESRLNTILSNVGDAILNVASDGTIVQANAGAERLLAREGTTLTGMMIGNYVQLDPTMNVDGNFSELEHGPVKRDLTVLKTTGERFPVEATASRARIGGEWHVVLCLRDMSERVGVEEALRRGFLAAEQARRLTRSVIDAANDVMLFLSQDQRVVLVNRRHMELLGVRDDQVLHGSLDELERVYSPIFSDTARLLESIRRPFDSGEQGRTLEVTQQLPAERELRVMVMPVPGTEGDIAGTLCVIRDFSTEREADRMKSDFVSLVSHELRTPLTAIQGYVDLLLEGVVGELNPQQLEFLGIVGTSAARLVALTNDLLDVARIEAGHMDLHPVEMDVEPPMRSVISTLQANVDAKQQRLTVELPDDLPMILADGNRFIQILTNLLSNASKFTGPQGEIVVRAIQLPSSVRFEVQDSGAGLTAEEQSRLFTRFYRVRNLATQRAGGTGLGLAISKSLVEAQGGTIGVASSPGEGSTFFFTLPAIQTNASRPEADGSLECDLVTPALTELRA